MLVYHGSSHRFEKARIVKKNTKDSSKLNEGYGIYFSLDYEVAKSYGLYVYTLELNPKDVIDFRKKSVCKSFLNKIIKEVQTKFGVNIVPYVDFNYLLEALYDAQIGVIDTGRQIALYLDSNENYYNKHQDKVEEIEEFLYNAVVKKLLGNKAYLFNYNIKDVGIIKNEDIVRVVKREKMA